MTVVEIEADTVALARQKIPAHVPDGAEARSVRVVSEGEQATVRATGETFEGAFMKAQHDIPAGAVIVDKKELPSSPQTITVEAMSRRDARERLRKAVGKPTTLGLPAPIQKKSFRLSKRGKRGFVGIENAFLGIGWSYKQRAEYQAEVIEAAVELTYKPKAKIAVEIVGVSGGHVALIVSGPFFRARTTAGMIETLGLAADRGFAGAAPLIAAEDGANVQVQGAFRHISRLAGDWILVVPEEALPHLQAEMSSWALRGDPVDGREPHESGQSEPGIVETAYPLAKLGEWLDSGKG